MKINLTRPNTPKVPSVAAEEARQIGTSQATVMEGRTERGEERLESVLNIDNVLLTVAKRLPNKLYQRDYRENVIVA